MSVMPKQKCSKVCFSDEENAEFYLRKLQKTSNRPVTPIAAYLCPKCFWWHLTSKPNRDTKLLAQKDAEIQNLKEKVNNLKIANEQLVNKLKRIKDSTIK